MSVGKYQLSSKTWLIIGIVIAIIVLAVIASASQGTPEHKVEPTPTVAPVIIPPDDGIVTVTIQNHIGISAINITNLNTQNTYTLTLIDLPFTFDTAKGSILKFSVASQEGYTWNSWASPMFIDAWGGTFNNHNPMIMTASYDVVMTPKCNMNDLQG